MNNKLQPWLIWIAATSFVFFQFLLQTSTSVMIPAFMHDFQISLLQIGILSSSYFYSYLTMQLPAGILVDRFGARLVLSVGIILCTLGCWLFTHASNFYLAQGSRILMGLGCAPVIGTTFALVAYWFSPRRFALMIGLTDTLGMLGGVTGQAYLANWVEHSGWRQTMAGCTFIALIIALLIICVVRDKPANKTLPTNNTATINTQTHSSIFSKLSTVIQLPQIWFNGIFVAMIWGVAIGFTGLWSVPFLQNDHHLSLATAAAASSMVFLGLAVTTPLIGWLSDAYINYRRQLMLTCTLIGLSTLCGAIYLSKLPLLILFILLFLFGCSTASYIISFSIVREITAPEARGTAMGFTNMMSIAVGSPLLQPFIGYLLNTKNPNTNIPIHEFKMAFIILPVCLLIALLSLYFINPIKE